MTLRDALTRATSQLSAHPEVRETALQDAAALLLHVLGVDRATLMAHPERSFTRDQQIEYQAALQRRLELEPIQYITGTQDFYGMTLRVTPATLIPRPETELLVETVVTRLAGLAAPRILDVGTGSGAIALALARHLPGAMVTAVDLSPAALEVARANAQAAGLGHKVQFVVSDLLAGLEQQPATRFDAIVSNPPYVATSDAGTLHAQVREYEPGVALFAGADGLDVYRRLIPEAREALAHGGLLALELGFGQREALATLLERWKAVEFLADLNGIDRVALARL